MIQRLIALTLLLTAAAASCGGDDKNTVVVYTAHDPMFSEPILKQFEKTRGIKVMIVSDTEATKTVGLVNKLISLKDRPEADVFWNNEIMRTIVLKRKGILRPYSIQSARDIPAIYKDHADNWTGYAGRARVILYNTSLVKKEEAPRSLSGLTNPKWKGKVAIGSPLFGSTATHIAALYSVLGREKTKELLEGLKRNNVRITAGNAMARNLVMNGEMAVCLTDTDDANGAIIAGKPVEMIYPDQDSIGTMFFPNTLMLINGAPHAENGIKLLEYLASKEVEEMLARSKSAQMPVRNSIKPHSDRFDPKKIKFMEIDWEKAADCLEESTKLVREILIK